MIQSTNDSQPERSAVLVTRINVALTWVCAATMAGVAVMIGHGDAHAAYLGALAVGRSLAVAVLITCIARRWPSALPTALLAAGMIQILDTLAAVLWGQWGGVSALAVAAVHLASSRWLRANAPEGPTRSSAAVRAERSS